MSTTIQDLDAATNAARRYLATVLPPLPAGLRRTFQVHDAPGGVYQWLYEDGGVTVRVFLAPRGGWHVSVSGNVGGDYGRHGFESGTVNLSIIGATDAQLDVAIERCVEAVRAGMVAADDALAMPECGCDLGAGVTCTPDGDAGPREQAAMYAETAVRG